MIIRLRFIFFLLLTLTKISFCQQNLVSVKAGKLLYTPYANEGETNSVNIIPDFSAAGYGGGGVSLPEIKVVHSLSPLPGECRELIQQAIDKVSLLPLNKNGYRGAILLKKGRYHIDGSLFVKASGVILRGEGNGMDGTVLIATRKSKHDFIIIQGDGDGYGMLKDSRKKIVSDYIPTGARVFEIEPGHTFSKGDSIIIQKNPNEAWIKTLEMAQYGWVAGDYRSFYERIITAVDGNKITIDIPFVDPVENKYGGGEVFKSAITGRIMHCGLENLRMESVFENNTDEAHGWNAIVLKRTAHCWVKNVVAKYFGYSCVSISVQSVFNTIQDCAMIDPKSLTTGGRKYSFNIEKGSACNLFQRCISWGGRHDYVTGSHVPGPNVFLDCIAENTFADVGPHHRWATGLLFDNIYGGQIRVQNRKAMGSGHGWAGAQTMFWNCHSIKSDIKVESPIGAMNWGIGNVGETQSGEGYWESWGKHVEPRSLYLKQLEERLGPDAVKNITTPQQRNGTIWSDLRDRASQLAGERSF